MEDPETREAMGYCAVSVRECDRELESPGRQSSAYELVNIITLSEVSVRGFKRWGRRAHGQILEQPLEHLNGF